MIAAEKTLVQLDNFPQSGKSSKFNHPDLLDIRQKAIRGFEKYLIFYRLIEDGVEIIRIIHGSRDIENIGVAQTKYDINLDAMIAIIWSVKPQ